MANTDPMLSASPPSPQRNGPTANPLSMVQSLWLHRDLATAMFRREIQARYRGSLAGPLWYLIQNAALLAIYSFVFGHVFQARWPQLENAPPGTFAASLFIGILVFNVFSEAVGRSPTLIASNLSLVKNVVFPLDILCVVSTAVALLNALVGFAVLVAATLLMSLPISLHALLLPLVLPPVLLLTVGTAWLFASLGVYVRDVAQVVGLLTTGLMFFSPIFYPASALPEWARWLIFANPLSVPIESARALLLTAGSGVDWGALAISYLAGAAVACIGWVWFQLTRNGFADVV